MTISDVAVAETVKAGKVNEIIEAVNLTGMVGVVPTSVAGTGVTVDTLSGLVSFSSATTIDIDGVFTSTFRNYRIFVESSGTASNLVCNLRVGGSNATAAEYDRTEIVARNGAVTSDTLVAQTSWVVCGIVNTLIQGDMDISVPFLTAATTTHARFGAHANPAVKNTANGLTTNYCTHRPSTSHDGIRFTYSAAQSGTIRIHGYN